MNDEAAVARELRQALIAELLERIHTMPPAAFEDLVLDVLHKMARTRSALDAYIASVENAVADRLGT